MEIVTKKSLGQHFLTNPRILGKIVAAAEITDEDMVLEVGPGTGNLTQKLLEKAGKVITVEKDHRLIDFLKEKFSAYGGPAEGWKNKNIEIVEADILKLDIKKLIGHWSLVIGNYKIVANIPYYITSRFLRKVFTEWPRPKIIILTIQKEVAQRITAKTPKMNLLAVSVRYFAEPKIVSYISKENFRPRPKVDSAIIKLIPREKLPTDDVEKFFKIIRAGFSQKRKLLISNLEKLGFDKKRLAENFEKIGISPESRAENLNIDEWIELSKTLTIK